MSALTSLPTEGYVRLERIIGNKKKNIPPVFPVGRTTWLQGVTDGIYPKPVRLSERTVAWNVEDIRKLIAEREVAKNEELL